jgi:glycine betaine/proline transport system permease protein
MPFLPLLTELVLLAVSIAAAVGVSRLLHSPLMTATTFLLVNFTFRFAIAGWPLEYTYVLIATAVGLGIGLLVNSRALGLLGFAALLPVLVLETHVPGIVLGFHGFGDVVAAVLALATGFLVLRLGGRLDRAAVALFVVLVFFHLAAALPNDFPTVSSALVNGAIVVATLAVGWYVWRVAVDGIAAGVAAVAVFLALQFMATIPADNLFVDGELGDLIRGGTNDFVRSLVVNYGDAFEAFSDVLLQALVWLERLLRDIPAAVFIVLVGILAYAASRRVGLALAMVASLVFVGFLGLWTQAMQTIAIMIVSIVLAILIGMPMGIFTAKSNSTKAAVNPVLDLMQTIPSFVYLIPAVMLFGLGKVSAVLAVVIYATPPLIRLTDLGIRQVDAEVVEASRAFGANRWQMLGGVQIPLALPSIMQGLNQTMMMALAMVVIASMIGARGLGETVLLGLQRNDAGQGLIGGVGIVVLAIIFDRISQAVGARAQTYRSAGH